MNPAMKIQAIVNTALESGYLSLEQDRKLTLIMQNYPCSPEEHEAMDHLIEALIEGSVKAEGGLWGDEDSFPQSA